MDTIMAFRCPFTLGSLLALTIAPRNPAPFTAKATVDDIQWQVCGRWGQFSQCTPVIMSEPDNIGHDDRIDSRSVRTPTGATSISSSESVIRIVSGDGTDATTEEPSSGIYSNVLQLLTVLRLATYHIVSIDAHRCVTPTFIDQARDIRQDSPQLVEWPHVRTTQRALASSRKERHRHVQTVPFGVVEARWVMKGEDISVGAPSHACPGTSQQEKLGLAGVASTLLQPMLFNAGAFRMFRQHFASTLLCNIACPGTSQQEEQYLHRCCPHFAA